MDIDVDAEKRALRKRMRALRLVAEQKHGPEAGAGVLRHCMAAFDALGIRAGVVVAGYWPIMTEVDVRPLMARCEALGALCALPVLMDADQPLLFRRWRPTEDVVDGPRGTFEPLAAAPEVEPDVLLVPMLAFDDRGYRLGQGGGYYDRTLAALRAVRPVTAVGVAYSVLRQPKVPAAPHDQRLDWIATEAALTRVPS